MLFAQRNNRNCHEQCPSIDDMFMNLVLPLVLLPSPAGIKYTEFVAQDEQAS